MSLHRIRLAGPWEFQYLTETGEIATAGTVHKCQLPFPSEPGIVADHGVLLRRRFHEPTGIGARTTVTVTVEIQDGIPQLSLNGRILTGVEDSEFTKLASSGVTSQWRFDVSGLLKPYNELQVRLNPLRLEAHPRLHAAALEIRESS